MEQSCEPAPDASCMCTQAALCNQHDHLTESLGAHLVQLIKHDTLQWECCSKESNCVEHFQGMTAGRDPHLPRTASMGVSPARRARTSWSTTLTATCRDGQPVPQKVTRGDGPGLGAVITTA
jgi:hypothetical protein